LEVEDMMVIDEVGYNVAQLRVKQELKEMESVVSRE
jgi:hypothetical protein